MGKEDWSNRVAPVLIESVPLCQWGFNKSWRFVYVSGCAEMFRRQTEELLQQHVSIIDDPSGSWVARLDRILLRLEIEDHHIQTPASRTTEIQRVLGEALSRVRAFSAGQDAGTA